MLRHFRTLIAAVAVAALVGTAGGPALAFEDSAAPSDRPPILVDLALLRPVGIGLTLVGGVLFVPAAAITMVTRPSELGKPLETLVMQPVRFTFMRPMGEW